MALTVEHLVQEALLLSSESRTELVEAILERTPPSAEFIGGQVSVVLGRMESVREGRSELIPDAEAHRQIRKALRDAR